MTFAKLSAAWRLASTFSTNGFNGSPDVLFACRRKNFLTCIKLGQPHLTLVVRRAKLMNVQRLNLLLPSGGNHLVSPLLASAFTLEASIPADMEWRLSGLAPALHRGRKGAAR